MKQKSLKQSVISTVFGLTLFFAALGGAFYLKSHNAESASYFFGGASGLFAVLLFQIIRILLMLKNPKYRKKQENEQNDERLIGLRNKAAAVSYSSMIFLGAAASIACASVGKMALAGIFSAVISISLLIYIISYAVLSRRE